MPIKHPLLRSMTDTLVAGLRAKAKTVEWSEPSDCLPLAEAHELLRSAIRIATRAFTIANVERWCHVRIKPRRKGVLLHTLWRRFQQERGIKVSREEFLAGVLQAGFAVNRCRVFAGPK